MADTKKRNHKKIQSFMKNKTGSVRIHKKDGAYQEERTYLTKDVPQKRRLIII